ncbi:MAG: hypothetical protein V3S89_09960 [Desulfobacterales bacterium]
MKSPDNQSVLRQFEELEKRVERLIGFLASQEEKTLALRKKTEDLERELQERTEAGKHHEAERNLIRSKIDTLLTKLDGISSEG